ncbi:MAG: type II toxin-antitoxin system PrlF family antitoxin [Rhizobiaceae bacterium]|jgi:AbrB family looped-hinge helix DNA binding protein|nr:type II toxin-antitoxin system PrlF family antitoxin [Rhizobiaceae bacterium]
MIVHSRVTAKGQTTIPAEIRDVLGVKPGDMVRYEILDGVVTLDRRRSAREFAGVLHDPTRKPLTVEEIDLAVAEGIIGRSEGGLDRR